VADISSDRGWRFFVMYGQTEAGPRISYLPPDLVRKHSTSIGYPIPGVRMSIVDDDGKLITENGVSGELVVESPSIMLGYAMGHADLALGDELSGRLATGDLTMRDAKGFFQITGRKKRFIKLHGNRVGLDEVEMRLASLGHNVTCVGEDDILWIVLQADGDPDATRTVALQQFSLPARSIRALRAPVPLTAAGKPRYDELLDALKAGLSC
jgi:acyl-coenzyme A synthetase/AMP-(fatty) acid ligase